ncbi:tetratricopeptide repeat protein [Streptomyces sp. NPDC056975]|uniref:tetratricopeptide repeat protein n=1 Tax=Streptomyces sp. NPDC056975 TaxID=3345985 RepID=UPI003633545D
MSAVVGMGGVGKTALVIHAAHQARARGWFPGGILFADMRGYSENRVEAGEAADRFLRALGTKAKDLPITAEEKLDAWRLTLEKLAASRRPLLVVLDNVRTPGQIAALLPDAPHRALVTSRHNLSILPTSLVALTPLSPRGAVDLLDKTLRAGGRDDRRATAQSADALRLVEQCGYLPLALRIIGALLRDEPDRPLAAQAGELEDQSTRLDTMEYDGDDDHGRPLAVRASFELSYGHLTDPQSRAFRILAAVPGPDISTCAAAALLGQTSSEARRLLASLTRAHLLNAATTRTEGLPAGDCERWTMHDLIRLFADDLGCAHSRDDGRDLAVTQLLDHYVASTEAANARLRVHAKHPAERFISRDQALSWLENERLNLLASAIAPAADRHCARTQLPLALARFLDWRRDFDDLITLLKQAIEIFRETSDRHGEGRAQNIFGVGMRQVRRFEEAITAHTEAVQIFRETRDRNREAGALDNLGIPLQRVGRLEEALSAHTEAVQIFRETRNRQAEGVTLGHLGLALDGVDRIDEAVDAHAQSAAIAREVRDRQTEGVALCNLGSALQQVGRAEEAVDALRQSAAIAREVRDRRGEGGALNNLGSALQQVGRAEEAVDAHSQALHVYQEISDRHREGGALNNLGLALKKVGRIDEAIEAHTQAAAIYREIGERHGEGTALNHLGLALRKASHFEEALEAHAQAVHIYREVCDRRGEGRALNNLGLALEEVGRGDEAIDAFAQADAITVDAASARSGGALNSRSPAPPTRRPAGH